MNRYPLWKYILVALALTVGLFYTLPNFFGEVPAVQISPAKSTAKVDEALLSRVDQALTEASIKPDGIFLDPASIKVRLANTDLQLKAKDVLQSKLGENYVVALNLLSSSPHWLAKINALPMYLGLDLRGGVHFLLQVDMKGALTKAADRYAADIRTTLRGKEIRYAGISRDGQNVVVKFRDGQTRDQATTEIAKQNPDLLLNPGQAGSDYLITAALRPEVQKRIQEFAIQQNITTLRNRVNELGVAEPIVQQAGSDRVVVQLPGVQDTAKAKDILGRTATLEVRMVDEEHSDAAALQAAIAGQTPLGDELLYDREGAPHVLKREVILTGDRISDAQPGFDSQTGEPAVHINLDGRGATIFQQITRESVGKRMAMVLVEKGKGEVITAPVIRSEIPGGRVQISGRMSTTEARDVALLLRAGALAAPMEIVEERTVGPSLGADNITRGFRSTMIGFGAIAAFMIVY